MLSHLFKTAFLLFCSFYFGNGYSPIFYISARSSLIPVGLYLLTKLMLDLITGVFAFTWLNFIAFCLVLYFQHLVPRYKSLFGVVLFWFISNSFCFFEMSSLYHFYPQTFSGYVTCLVAGIPYALRMLGATMLFELARRLAGVDTSEGTGLRRFNRFSSTSA